MSGSGWLMSGSQPGVTPEPPDYLVGRIQEVLACDPRVGEQTIEVKVVGEKIFLSGHVMTEARREAISDIVGAEAPGHDIRNEVTVLQCPEGARMEHLS